MSTYHLFLDDERYPPEDDNNWVICRNFDEAVEMVKSCAPDYISIDHDLGDSNTGYDFAKWLVEYDIDNDILGPDFNFYVHSMNPVGNQNINLYMRSYLTQKRGDFII